MHIPIIKPYLDKEEEHAVIEVLRSGWLVQGRKVQEFESLFAQLQGAKYAFAVNSATSGLHLALIAVGIGEGDEVIVPAFSFPATANVVLMVKAKPVFVDIDLSTYNIDVNRIEPVINSNTRAIIPVHLFGLPADMDPIMELAHKYGLKVIEDAACAHMSEYKGCKVGTIGDVGVFSFHPRKPITTGEGGIVTTNDPKIAEDIRIRRNHGETISDIEREHRPLLYPDFDRLGFNYRMTDIQAAIGVEQLKKLPWIINKRRELANRYTERLMEHPFFVPPIEPPNHLHNYQSYVVLIKPDSPYSQDEITLKLQERGIMVRKGTYSLPHIKLYRSLYGFTEKDFPNSFYAEHHTLTLPLYPTMTTEEQDYVIDTLYELFK